MANSLSELSVGHAYARIANTESNLTVYQKLEQQLDWILALNLDWRAVGIFVAVVMAILAVLLFVLMSNSKSTHH